MEYVHNAQQIFYLVTERITKYINKVCKDKRYKHFVKSSQYATWRSPIYHAQRVYEECQLADMKREPSNRLVHLSNATENLQLLESSTQSFYHNFKSVIKDKFIELLTDKIDYQKKLIVGVKRSCGNVSWKSHQFEQLG